MNTLSPRLFAYTFLSSVSLLIPADLSAYVNRNPWITWSPPQANMRINGSSFPDQSYVEAVEAGLLSWSSLNVVGTSFHTAWVRGATEGAVLGDGLSTITMVPGLPEPGVGAVTQPTIIAASGDTVITEMDVLFSAAYSWASYDSFVDKVPTVNGGYDNYSVEAVMRHEMGHAAGFLDLSGSSSHEDRPPLISSVGTLYSYGGAGSPKLHADDRNGLRSYYPAAGSRAEVSVTGWQVALSLSLENVAVYPVPAPAPNALKAGQNLDVVYTIENP